MAGDWIKMRGALIDHPKVIAITRRLHASAAFREWLTPGGSGSSNGQIVSGIALRCVTTSLLMRVWSLSREHGKFDGDDLVLEHSAVTDLDEMAGAPGIGEAMLAVRWVQELDHGHGVKLPNFSEFNVPMSAAEKQKSYRERKRAAQDSLPSEGNATCEFVTSRVEKRREEKEESKTSPPEGGAPSLFPVEPKPKVKPLAVTDLVAEGVGEDVATEWLAIRKRKRAPLTPLSWKLTKAEIEKAGWTVDAAIRKCVSRSWIGFEAAWVQNDRTPATPIRQSLAERAAQDDATARSFLDA